MSIYIRCILILFLHINMHSSLYEIDRNKTV